MFFSSRTSVRAARARALKNRNGVTILASAPPGASATGKGGTAITQHRGSAPASQFRSNLYEKAWSEIILRTMLLFCCFGEYDPLKRMTPLLVFRCRSKPLPPRGGSALTRAAPVGRKTCVPACIRPYQERGMETAFLSFVLIT